MRTDNNPGAQAFPWRIVVALTGIALVSYTLRVNISVAGPFMMSDLSLNRVQLGQVFSVFLLGYALFQTPAGLLADRFGPQVVLTVAMVSWGFCTLLTGLVPATTARSVGWCFLSLLAIRFLLGVSEAATFPAIGLAVAKWVAAPHRALASACSITGASIGSAITPALISGLIVKTGWRGSFYIASSFSFGMIVIWMWCVSRYAPKSSLHGHGSRTIVTPAEPYRAQTSFFRKKQLRQGNFWLLCLSYFFENYVLFMFVFWLFTYLIEIRHFSALRGGFFAGLPFAVASVMIPLGGALSDKCVRVWGTAWGRRIAPIAGLLLSAIFLLEGLRVEGSFTAVAVLSLSTGFVMFTEGAFWATAVDLGGSNAGAASGIMNTFGSLGGVVSTALVPVLVDRFGWKVAFATGAVFAAIGALVWLGIRADAHKSPGIANPRLELSRQV